MVAQVRVEEHPLRVVAEAFLLGAWFAIQTSESPRTRTARAIEHFAHRLLFAGAVPRHLRVRAHMGKAGRMHLHVV